MKKRILVTGASRSGTLSTSRMLMQLGLDTPHEYMGADGTVSCYMFEDSPEGYPYSPNKKGIHGIDEQLSNYEFELIVHLYRDPRHCIPSNVKIMNKSHQQWLADKGIFNMEYKPKILRMMHMWYDINRRIEKLQNFGQAYIRYNIRDSYAMIREVAAVLSLRVPDNFKPKHMHKGTGYLAHDKHTWTQLAFYDAVLAHDIKFMYEQYEGNHQ